MMASTRERKPGGRGAIASSARSTADRWIALESAGVGKRARLSPRNQETESTARAEKMAPAPPVDSAALRLRQDSETDRLADPVADAAADGAHDDQDQHRA